MNPDVISFLCCFEWLGRCRILTFSILSLSHAASGLMHHCLFFLVTTLKQTQNNQTFSRPQCLLGYFEREYNLVRLNWSSGMLKYAIFFVKIKSEKVFKVLTGRRGVGSPLVVSARSTFWLSLSSWSWRWDSRVNVWSDWRNPLKQQTQTRLLLSTTSLVVHSSV